MTFARVRKCRLGVALVECDPRHVAPADGPTLAEADALGYLEGFSDRGPCVLVGTAELVRDVHGFAEHRDAQHDLTRIPCEQVVAPQQHLVSRSRAEHHCAANARDDLPEEKWVASALGSRECRMKRVDRVAGTSLVLL